MADPEATTPAPTTPRPRLSPPDAARGLALVQMVLIHASFFAKLDLVAERYADRRTPVAVGGWLPLALLIEPAPVLFWFLLGVRVALIDRRRADARASDRFLLTRALVMIALDQVLVSWQWAPSWPPRIVPGFELLTSLALALVALVPLRRLGDRAIALLAAALALVYPAVIRAVPEDRLESLTVPLRVLVSYDFARAPVVTFPLAGWLVLPLLGLLAGRRLASGSWRRPRPWLLATLACLAVSALSRLAGWGDYTPWAPGEGLFAWFVMSKGPPGLDYLSWNLALGSLALAAFSSARLDWRRGWVRWLVLFGQVSLFLFVIHLGVCWLTARVMLHLLGHAPGLRYLATSAVALTILTALGRWWRGLRAQHPGSALRYL